MIVVMRTPKKLVMMDSRGRLTMPAEARQQLHLDGQVELIAEIEGNAVTFRPAATISGEDAWAYAPAHLKRLLHALDQADKGQVVRGSEIRLS